MIRPWFVVIASVTGASEIDEVLTNFDVQLLQTELNVETNKPDKALTPQDISMNVSGMELKAGVRIDAKRTSHTDETYDNQLKRRGAPDNLSDAGAFFLCAVITLATLCFWAWLLSMPWWHTDEVDDFKDDEGKDRFPILDNMKLFCMVMVFLAHGGAHCLKMPNGFVDSSDVPNLGLLQATAPGDAIGGWAKANYFMYFFSMCSGAVASCDATNARMAVLFVGILLPIILLWAYAPILEGTIITDPQKALDHYGLQSFSEMFWNAEPWYLKGLVFWRVWLYVFGQFPDAVLIVLAFLTDMSYEHMACSDWLYDRWMTNDPTINYFRYLPSFILGYVFFRKRKLMGGMCSFIRQYPILQPISLVYFIICMIDSATTGIIWSRLDDWMVYAGQPGYLLLKCLTSLAFITLCGAWVPVNVKPIMTKAGSRTLTGYLLNGIAFRCALKPFLHVSFLLPSSWGLPWFLIVVLMLPALCVFCCSEVVNFMLWPIFEPGWLMAIHKKSCAFSDLCRSPWAVKVGWQKWVATSACFHLVWLLSGAYMLLGDSHHV